MTNFELAIKLVSHIESFIEYVIINHESSSIEYAIDLSNRRDELISFIEEALNGSE